MVVGQEFVAVELEEVPELPPKLGSRVAPGIGLEGDVGDSSVIHDRLEVVLGEVAFIGRDFANIEIRACVIHKALELGAVVGVLVGDNGTGDNVGLGSADEVRLDVLGGAALPAPLVIEPAVVGGSGEAGRVNGEVVFHLGQGHCAFRDQGLEDRGQVLVVQVTGDAVVVGGRIDQALFLGVPDVGSGPATGHRGIDLHDGAENNVRQGQARTTGTLPRRIHNAVTQGAEEVGNALLLMRLGVVVSGPVLPVGDADPGRLGLCRERTLGTKDLDGDDMLAAATPRLMVRARAGRLLSRIEVHDVGSGVGLRRNEPQVTLAPDLRRGGDHDGFFVSRVHVLSSYS